jgi:hypothetical protein
MEEGEISLRLKKVPLQGEYESLGPIPLSF